MNKAIETNQDMDKDIYVANLYKIADSYADIIKTCRVNLNPHKVTQLDLYTDTLITMLAAPKQMLSPLMMHLLLGAPGLSI